MTSAKKYFEHFYINASKLEVFCCGIPACRQA
ncbi:MAG: hypothetical protein ACI9CF_001075, partial [Candidatus Omnitrophota bacterium]